MKQNRAMLKKRRSVKSNDLYNYESDAPKPEFKTVHPQELKRIKKSIVKNAEKDKRKERLVTLITVSILLSLFFYLYMNA